MTLVLMTMTTMPPVLVVVVMGHLMRGGPTSGVGVGQMMVRHMRLYHHLVVVVGQMEGVNLSMLVNVGGLMHGGPLLPPHTPLHQGEEGYHGLHLMVRLPSLKHHQRHRDLHHSGPC